jgi:hypothetical protein
MKLTLQKTSVLFTWCILFTLIWSVSLQAESKSNDGWNFQIAPYGWLAGQKGEVATLPPLPPADTDIDFYDDIFGNINGSITFVGEARKGRYGLVMDVGYNDIEIEDPTEGPVFNTVKSRTKSWMVSAACLYGLLDEERKFMDLIGGLRYWSIDSELTLTEALMGPFDISHKESWVDPIIGLKGLRPFGNSRLFYSYLFMIGGFGVGSDFMWEANLNFGYQWTKTFSTTLGYRYMDVDYDDDGFLYDIAQDGLVLGLSWRF